MNLKTLGLAGAAALLTATAGYAQPPSPPQARAQYDGQRARPDPAQIAERHAQRLRDTLQLRPDQDAALRAYVDASRPQFHRERGERGERGAERGEARAMTTPERLDRMRARMAEHQAAFERRAEATKRFYAQLSPSQRRAFDASGWMGGRHGRGGHDGHRGGRG